MAGSLRSYGIIFCDLVGCLTRHIHPTITQALADVKAAAAEAKVVEEARYAILLSKYYRVFKIEIVLLSIYNYCTTTVQQPAGGVYCLYRGATGCDKSTQFVVDDRSFGASYNLL